MPTNLKIGVALAAVAALFPLTVGSVMYARFFIGLAHPSEPWLSGELRPSPYTLDGIEEASREITTDHSKALADDFVLAQHMEMANVINTGAAALFLVLFGVRNRHRWAWWTVLGIFLWVGLNDALALLHDKQFPIPAIPEVLGLIGLLIARRAVFGEPAER